MNIAEYVEAQKDLLAGFVKADYEARIDWESDHAPVSQEQTSDEWDNSFIDFILSRGM